MSGTGSCFSNIQDITETIKIYDGGVSSDDLTLSLGRDWEGTDTLQHGEVTVETVDFLVQITTTIGRVIMTH